MTRVANIVHRQSVLLVQSKMDFGQINLSDATRIRAAMELMQGELKKMNERIGELTNLLSQALNSNQMLLTENQKMCTEVKRMNDEMLRTVAIRNNKPPIINNKRMNAVSDTPLEKRFRKFQRESLVENRQMHTDDEANTSISSIETSSSNLSVSLIITSPIENVNNDFNNKNENWTTVTAKNHRKTNTKGESKVTPIQIEHIGVAELKSLCADLTKKVNKDDMFVHQIGERNTPRIFCESEAAKNTVISHLKDAGIQYNSYNNGETRKKAFIIRGLICDDSSDAINQIHEAILGMGGTVQFQLSLRSMPSEPYLPTRFLLSTSSL